MTDKQKDRSTEYMVWCPGIGENIDDGCKILAAAHEDAALIWAERADYVYGFFTNGDSIIVLVAKIDADDKPGPIKAMTIKCEIKKTFRVLSSIAIERKTQ